MFTRLLRYRPTRTSDSEGGFTATLGDSSELWGYVRVHDSSIRLVTRTDEDVAPEDIIEIDGEYYRVLTRQGHVRGAHKVYGLEKTQKPVTPA